MFRLKGPAPPNSRYTFAWSALKVRTIVLVNTDISMSFGLLSDVQVRERADGFVQT